LVLQLLLTAAFIHVSGCSRKAPKHQSTIFDMRGFLDGFPYSFAYRPLMLRFYGALKYAFAKVTTNFGLKLNTEKQGFSRGLFCCSPDGSKLQPGIKLCF